MSPARRTRRLVLLVAAGIAAGGATMAVAAVLMAEPPPGPEPEAPAEPAFATRVERGAWLFEHRGCPACHGANGGGGVANANYVLDTVPALDTIADRLMLWERPDADAVVAMIEGGEDPRRHPGEPPFPDWPRFVAQYDAVVGVILNGSVAGKKDPAGPAPPLQMPSWRGQLAERDIHAIVAYLISRFDWEGADDGA